MLPALQSITAKTFGFVFIAIGLLGFFDNPIVSEDGFFSVNVLHNFVHLASGIVALAVGFSSERASWMYNLGFGAVYGVVTLLGFLNVNMMLAINMADNFLHLFIAATLLGVASMAPAEVRHEHPVRAA